jgi:hypothetical protein
VKYVDCIFLAETSDKEWQLEVFRQGPNNFEVVLTVRGSYRGGARGYSYVGVTAFVQDQLNKAKFNHTNYQILRNELSKTLN